MLMKYCLPFLLTLLFISDAAAQHSSQKSRKHQTHFTTTEDWYKTIEGKPFALKGPRTTVDGKVIDFSLLQHPVFVCLGFAACPPCRRQLPLFIEATATYPDIDFVYITYDSEETRLNELSEIAKKNFKPPANYYIIHMEQQEINRYDLTLAYPTQYFIGKEGIVKYMHCGGEADEPEAEIRKKIADIITRK